MMTFIWAAYVLTIIMALLTGYMMGQIKVFTELVEEGALEYTGDVNNG